MKVLFIADTQLDNPTSGAEQVLNKQALGLSQKNLGVFAITRKNGNSGCVEYNNINGVIDGCYRADAQKVIRFFISLFKIPVRIFSEFKKNSSFIASICHQPFTFFFLIINGKLSDIPVLYVFHSPNHEEFLLSLGNRNGYRGFPQALIRKMIEGFCLRRSRKIMVLSQYMKQKVMDIHRIPADRIVVNPGGVDLDRFKSSNNRKRLKEELQFPVGKIHLLTIRNLEPRMGLDNLLKAILLLKDKENTVHLIIGGDGPERKNLENMIQDYGLIHDVTMTGFIRSDRLSKYYCAADFFILPTHYLEGFGLVTPESMACGTPVIGTPVGGTREILSGFDPQFLFEDVTPEAMADGIKNSIESHFQYPHRYNSLRRRCREYVENNYSWQRHVDQLKSMIDKLFV